MMDESSFFSTDRLVEFGLGLGVATQMVNSMNRSLVDMGVPNTPESDHSANLASTTPYYYAGVDGQACGPFGLFELVRLIAGGDIPRETYIWHLGMSSWLPANEVSEVLRLVALNPPNVQGDSKGSHRNGEEQE